MSVRTELEALLIQTEEKAAAIRTTLTLLTETSNGNRSRSTRTNGPATSSRQRTAAFLALFHPTQAITLTDLHKAAGPDRKVSFGPLIAHGYIKKTRKGYLRTAKAFEP